MTDLPTGTVTFLLTDIEGSTEYWDKHSEDMSVAIARHHAILHELVAATGGALPRDQGEGDAIFAAFERATDAVACAARIQDALATESWPEPTPVRVRIGIHTGEAELRDGNYFGASVSRCARIRGAGHGGQVLLSSSAAQLVRSALPPGAVLTDLGEHELRGLADPERIYQLDLPDWPPEFPPLKTLTARPNNLPRSLTRLIGRDAELAALEAHWRDGARLITLTGFGGAGKTRLALEAATGQLENFEDGVWLCRLEAAVTPGDVLAEVSRVLGVRDSAGMDVRQSLVAHLRPRRVLLVLDNLEQVLDAAQDVADLVASVDGLFVLATSREPLRVRGEREVPVGPLDFSVGAASEEPDPRRTSAAVALFVDRARAVRPDFELSASNAEHVEAICSRLDGLPLAIELAAARVKVFGPDVLARRLAADLNVLGSGTRDLPARQRGLQATIEWSFDLLDEAERRALGALSVFAGSWSIDAAEAICFPGDADALDLVSSLVDKSLVGSRSSSTGDRFALLNVIREFARSRLVPERSDEVELAHVAWFRELAETAREHQDGPEQASWHERLDEDHDNLRAALAAAIRRRRPDGIRLAAALGGYWSARGHLAEGSARLEEAIAHCPRDGGYVPGALVALSALRRQLGDIAGARDLAAEALAGSRRAGDRRGETEAYGAIAMCAAQVADPASEQLLRDAIDLAREVGVRTVESDCLAGLATLAHQRREVPEARRLLEACLEIDERLGDSGRIASTLNHLGLLAADDGDLDRATDLYSRALATREGLGDRAGAAEVLAALGSVARWRGDDEGAGEIYARALRTQREIGDVVGAAETLSLLAELDIAFGDHATASDRLGDCLRIARSAGIPGLVAGATRLLAELETGRGDLAAAERWVRESLESADLAGDPAARAMAMNVLGRILVAGERHAEADALREEMRRLDAVRRAAQSPPA